MINNFSENLSQIDLSQINWHDVIADLSGIETITDQSQVAKLSLDYYHFSPVLQPLLADKRGNLVVRPIDENEVLKIARICVKYKIPLTVRGAGTGNYGQCIPLVGGIILDTTKMDRINWIKPGLTSVQPGVKMTNFEQQARQWSRDNNCGVWEWRMFPSTYRITTIGGFIGGGSAGIGSINYGQLRDRGNIQAIRVVTLEDEPRIIELRGDAVQQVNHAYGTNGIMVSLEIPLAPAYHWHQAIITFADFHQATHFAQALGESDGIVKKLISLLAWPIPSYFTPLRSYLPADQHIILTIIAENSLESFDELVKEYQGNITYNQELTGHRTDLALYEFTWNDTTLYARKADNSLTYLQVLFPTGLDLVQKITSDYREEMIMHLEFFRVDGKVTPAALPIVKYTTEARLNEIIADLETQGAIVFNPHTYVLEDGGMKTINIEQLRFKAQVDPYGLLNPGKMRAWYERHNILL